MSELDLGLKVGVRRLLWSMGYSTRLDVELRGEQAAPHGTSQARGGSGISSGPETFTDLDVLGVFVAPGFRLTSTIADCKSGRRDKPTSRMFWARGVGDLFGADHVMLVREHEVNDATRQLSNRLGITVLPSADLAAMQQLYGEPLTDPDGALRVLFDRTAVANGLAAFTGLNRRLGPLLEYREFDFWVYEDHRNPVQLVAHLQDAAKHLEPRNPVHLALFVDLAWLYMLTLVRVCAHLQSAYLRDQDRGLQEYLFGGATNLREKVEVAHLLQSVAPEGIQPLDHLPPYYAQLRELVTRLMRRPAEVQAGLRYAEAVSALMAARVHVALPDAFGVEYRPIAAKLVADVCGFLVAAGGLDPEFRVQARAWLLGEPVATARKTPTLTGVPTGDTSGQGRSDDHALRGDGPVVAAEHGHVSPSSQGAPVTLDGIERGSSDAHDHDGMGAARGAAPDSGRRSSDDAPVDGIHRPTRPKTVQGELEVESATSEQGTAESGTSAGS
ncbi:hypothetical protein [Isoptericola variabilis]|uniref:Restriction endonuclease n=1 Tax=Isoptericola variabilis (strain 225) TaxID=743718 RepID=F6FRE3_ISOV2|nr:hypothetical protein [Isoptericola variabilis]AEG43904.1 hypothetical protein Isova_1129 [Isoptericola variabilis 225]TWH30494.1 hypothetical protein L600_000300000470 [Isoptericola variabilis J7]